MVTAIRIAGMLLVSCLAAAPTATAQAGPTGAITGVVLDRADGTPLADVVVQIQESKIETTTDESGRFELANVPAGARLLYVSIVGFILVERPVQVMAGGTVDVRIILSEGTGTLTESVTVAGSRFREQEPSVAAQQTLGSAEIQNLRNLITNDPMRAIQVLPGVTTGDDFRSEFAVRGSGFSRMNFTFDGIPTTFLLHTVQNVQDGGSIAMLNGDILDGITLLNGSYPQRYGNRLGAQLDFLMREGSRERRQTRLGVSGTDASIVAEGPLAARRGSWLVSARKSYLEMLLKQISDDNDFGFGFSDAQAKLVYDLTASQRLDVTLVAGRSKLDQTVDPDDVNEVQDGGNAAQLVNVGWRVVPSPSFVLTQRLAFAANQSSNKSLSGAELDRGRGQDVTWRSDLIGRLSPAFTLEAGTQVQRQARSVEERRILGPRLPAFTTLQAYDEAAWLSSVYAQVRWTAGTRASLTPGVRVDHWSLASAATASPWVIGDLRLTDTLTLRGGGGVYRQQPTFEHLVGLRAGTDLVAERAYHADVGIEQSLGTSARWQLTVYNREERDVLFQRGSELRVVDGQLVPPSFTAPWANALDGYARGIELLVQRRSASGLTGWASYSYGITRYADRVTGETFDGDFDQRHTFNIHAQYRLTNRTSLAAKFRAGSNVPATGYWEQRGGAYFVSGVRNELRVPAYARLDLRGSRTFNWQGKRLTLFAELLNALGRDNVRYSFPGVNGRTQQAFGMFETLIPLVPSAGILLEF